MNEPVKFRTVLSWVVAVLLMAGWCAGWYHIRHPQPVVTANTPLLAQINAERVERLRELRAATMYVYKDIPDKRLYGESSTPDAFRDGRTYGTGIVITPQGDMLTAAHVVKGMCMPETQTSIDDVYCAVVSAGHREVHRAKLVKIDTQNDVAQLKILKNKDSELFASVPLIDATFDKKLEGREVLINGLPLGNANMAITGMVSNAVDNDEVCKGGKIRTTLAASPGNSGGALLDFGTGAVVGLVVTVIAIEDATSNALFLNVTCAVSAQHIRSFVE